MKSSFHVKLFVAIAIHIILTINLTDGLDVRQLAPPLTDDDKCKAAGPIGLACKSCLEIGRCVCTNASGCTDSGWSIISLGNCPNGQTCDNGKCVSNHMCVPTANTEFICTSTGMFPDPYSCISYHFCAPDANTGAVIPKSTPATCEKDGEQQYGYNPLTTFCSTKLLNNRCTTLPIPLCKKPFETGIVGNNPSLYYLCLNVTSGTTVTDVLYPIIQKCPFGRRYNIATQECRSI
ncbi:hypothetical protein RI129_010024 [Pyrocoelia pectoralis]|uniref:Chitin-binding type-2 domain-containing protein n=1 Tax=Pyrocoelia pectoralis TaxID=417401 RepID=A0AAN7ZFE6_9COLE